MRQFFAPRLASASGAASGPMALTLPLALKLLVVCVLLGLVSCFCTAAFIDQPR